MTTALTVDEVFDSLTGFDEMAIAQHFGRTVTELGDDPSMFGRALVFVVQRRDGATDDAARNASLEMRMKDVTEFFAVASEVEAGKDEPLAEQPESSLSSV